MSIVLVTGIGVAYWAEANGNPLLTAIGVDPAGGNMEGKEVRFGTAMSAFFAAATTGTSTGAVNAMHDSFTAARRPRAVVQHAARLHFARRRWRAFMAPRLAVVASLSPADGWTHAGVSR